MQRLLALICVALALILLGLGAVRLVLAGTRPPSNPLLPSAVAVDSVPAPSATSPPTPSATPTALPTSTRIPTVTAIPSPTPTMVPPLSDRFAAAPRDQVTEIRSGVIHIRRVTDAPLRINLLLLDLHDPRLSLGVGLHEGRLSGRARTSTLARQAGALAAVNGDLFSDQGLPQGLTIIDGAVAIAPKHRATFALSREHTPFIGYFTNQWTWQAEVRTDSAGHPVTLLNSPCPLDQICLFNRFAVAVPARAGDVKVLIWPDGRVERVLRETQVRVNGGMQLLQGTGAGARWLLEHAEVGRRLELQITTEPPLRQFSHAISGGPIILRDGAFVQDCMCALRDCRLTAEPQANLLCEDFTTEWKNTHYQWVRMPRTGIGYDREGRTLILATVDGYQPGYSRGITQEDFALLLAEFGADTAMELDGGGSATMWLDGRLVSHPPPEYGERYVANALLVFWNDALPVRRVVTER
jgi:hypothetical protein